MGAFGGSPTPVARRTRGSDAQSRERLRYQILEWLHGQVERDCQRVISASGLQERLGASAEAVYAAVEHLARVGLVRYVGAGPRICITEEGLEPFRSGERRRSIRDRSA